MKAKEVIRIGRRRIFAAAVAAFLGPVALVLPLPRELDNQDRIFSRQTDKDHKADLREDVDRHAS
jgi:hypothetical protein